MTPDEPKAGSEIDWEAAKESSESWAKGRPLLGDLKCTNAEETLAIAYLALRAELAQAKEEIERLKADHYELHGDPGDCPFCEEVYQIALAAARKAGGVE